MNPSKVIARICISVVIAVAVAGVAAKADTIAVPFGAAAPEKEDLREFSCAGKPLDLSREEIEKLAYAEFERRGGRLEPGKFETKLKRRGCDWWVFVTLQPAAPGAHFGVVVDGLSGKVKRYLPGA